jgi:hypothetical protein
MKQRPFADALKKLISDFDGLTIESRIRAIEQALIDLKVDQMEAERHAGDRRYGEQLMMEGPA